MSDDLSEGEFRSALSKFATGVVIITAREREDRPQSGAVGITVNSFASVSLRPPLVLWSVAKASRRASIFESAKNHAIHILAADQKDLCEAFTKDAHAFPETINWSPHGTPEIADCVARLECVRHAIYDGGDHMIFVMRVLSARENPSLPLLFFDKGLTRLA